MKLLFYCQHALGMGHFVRSAALAARLAQEFEITFLNGGQLPPGLAFPESVERIDLPPLSMREDGQLVSHAPGLSAQEALDYRRALMLDVLRSRRPDVVLVELFPFGRRKFEPELVPWLACARALPEPPLVVCSLRDLLVTGRVGQQRFDDRAQALCDRYIDLVLVHADPALARLEESFKPLVPLATPVAYTGFMGRGNPPSPAATRQGIVVSAGGGLVGEPLYRLAVAAHRAVWSRRGLRTTIVAGPFAPAPVVDWLRHEAASADGLDIVPHVPDLRPLLASAAVSVSQCGYNTALDLVATRVPALVVPYGGEREDEQRSRARRLADRGLLRCVPPDGLTPDELARRALDLMTFTPAGGGLMLDGAEQTAALLLERLADRQALAAASSKSPAEEIVR